MNSQKTAKILWSSFILFLPNCLFATDFNPADTAWIMTSTALVLLMTLPGLALFYGGLVQSKNVLSVLMQCFSIAAISSLLWFLFCYSLAFSGGNSFIGDFDKIMLSGVGRDSLSGSIPEPLFMLFQMTFAIITPALVVGGFAERMKYSAVMLFSALWLICVYTPITHWVWADTGWLFNKGLLDFAGGTVVHITAGVAALVAAMVIGPRRDFKKHALTPHNLTMTIIGAGMLWVGWFGFNGGSSLGANSQGVMAMLVTHISASAGVLVWLSLEWVKFGKPSVLGAVTGMVAGLGTITPASGYVGPGGAFIIGISAGFVCFYATQLIKNVLKIDDSLDVFPVHGVGGILGTLLVGIFASTELGLFSGYGFSDGVSNIAGQISIQFIGVAATFTYTAVVTFILLKIIDLLIGLRVDEEQEIQGLDIHQHEERGYDIH